MALVPSSDHSNPHPQAFQGLAFMAKKAKNQTPTEPLAKNKRGCSQICRLEASKYSPKVSSICTPSQHFRLSSSSPWPELHKHRRLLRRSDPSGSPTSLGKFRDSGASRGARRGRWNIEEAIGSLQQPNMALQTTMGASEARLLLVAALFGVVALSSSFAGVEAQATTETFTPFTTNSQYGNDFSVVWAPNNAWSGNNSTLVLSLTNSSG